MDREFEDVYRQSRAIERQAQQEAQRALQEAQQQVQLQQPQTSEWELGGRLVAPEIAAVQVQCTDVVCLCLARWGRGSCYSSCDLAIQSSLVARRSVRYFSEPVVLVGAEALARQHPSSSTSQSP